MFKVDGSKCTGCGLCLEVCPVEAIKLVDDKARISEDDCLGCGACQSECLNNAISEV